MKIKSKSIVNHSRAFHASRLTRIQQLVDNINEVKIINLLIYQVREFLIHRL